MFRSLQLLATAALLASGAAYAAEAGPALPDYPADQVASHTYVIHGPIGYPNAENQGFINNPAFVLTDGGVVVVDPGSSLQTGEMVLRQIRKVTQQPIIAILNTHVHGDHWLGNHAFRNADPQVPIYGHPQMIAAIDQGAGTMWVDNMERFTEGATRGTEVRAPNRAVKDGDEIQLGGTTFRFIHPGPAHTNNDLMIYLPQEEVLFLADNVCNRRIVRMDDGTFRGSVAAIDVALTLPAKVWIPGHGKTGDAQIAHAYRDYLDSLYKTVGQHYEEGLSDFEMKPLVATELERFATWPGFDDELGKHVSLALLEYEAASFE